MGFPRSEKLKGRKTIEFLFRNGKWVSSGNLRMIYIPSSETKLSVSVSKKFYKKAVVRNRIKRLLRETYRLNKEVLHESIDGSFHAMLFWVNFPAPKNRQEVDLQYRKLCEKIALRNSSSAAPEL